MALGGRDEQEALAARARRRDLVREARQLTVEEVGRENPEIGRLTGRGERHDRRPSAGDQGENRRHRMFEQRRLEREALVLAARGELLRQALAVMGHFGGERRRIEGHPEGVRQQVGERQGARGEQRQEVLPACEVPAVGKRGQVIAGLATGLVASDVGERLRQPPGGIRPLGEERQREDRGLPGLVVRALRIDLEAAQALDLAAEEIETQRLFVAGREEVEDATAHREVADLADQVDPAIAESRQAERQLIEVDLVAAARAGSASGRRPPAGAGTGPAASPATPAGGRRARPPAP